jgi:hypothetical protein
MLFSMMNSFLHFGHVRRPNVITSMTVATIRRAWQRGHFMGNSVGGNLMVRLAPGIVEF